MYCHLISSFFRVKGVYKVTTRFGIDANAMLLFFQGYSPFLPHRNHSGSLAIGEMQIKILVLLVELLFFWTDLMDINRVWDYIACKEPIFFHRLLRMLSLCSTGSLSLIEAIRNDPRSTELSKSVKSGHLQQNGFVFLWGCKLLKSLLFLKLCLLTENLEQHSIVYESRACSELLKSHLPRVTVPLLWVFKDIFIL
uniref:Vomeronasal type-1 receptor n=1 Tax=Oryctolagus cuniculus TaxID=9986 RepID=A0A5F9DJ41_RABIT